MSLRLISPLGRKAQVNEVSIRIEISWSSCEGTVFTIYSTISEVEIGSIVVSCIRQQTLCLDFVIVVDAGSHDAHAATHLMIEVQECDEVALALTEVFRNGAVFTDNLIHVLHTFLGTNAEALETRISQLGATVFKL